MDKSQNHSHDRSFENHASNAVVSALSPLQAKELAVLKEIVKVLDANHLHYCAIGGTCLGAVRHKGFIPWDDDIDIALPRKEYELFRTELYKQLPGYIKKADCDVSKSHVYLFTKIHDSTTTVFGPRFLRSPERIIGAFVDVYPLDGRPDDLRIRRVWFTKYYFLVLFNGIRRAAKEKIASPRGLVKQVCSGILKKLFRYNYFTDKLQALLSKYDISQCKTAIWNGTSGRRYMKERYYDESFLSEWFTDTVSVPFEDTTVQIPRQYHDYLTAHFGDYMKLPPENERRSGHEVSICDMETPCKYYVDLIEKGQTDRIEQIIKEKKRQ